jgi:hypothetical protein
MNFLSVPVYSLVESPPQPPEDWASGGVLDIVGIHLIPPGYGVGNVIRRNPSAHAPDNYGV